jgi:hypothetical protein
MEARDIARQTLLALAPFAGNDTLTASGAGSDDPATQLAQKAWGLLTALAQHSPHLTVALEIFQKEPDDQRNRERLAQQVADYLQQQQQAMDELRTIAGRLQQHTQAQPQGNISNAGENTGQQVSTNTGQMAQQVDKRQSSGVTIGSGSRLENVKIGDVAGGDIHKTDITMGDQIRTGDISGSGIAIGRVERAERNINTGGGDYAEGNIDKRKGNFVSGDQFNMSGNFSGAILNIKSTLSNVSQSIGAAAHGDDATKAELQALIAQLSAALEQVPAEQTADAEAVAETAKAAVEQATKEQPNQTLVKISAEGLKQAAQNLAAVLPAVLPLATRIAEAVQRMAG